LCAALRSLLLLLEIATTLSQNFAGHRVCKLLFV
jgi:hypothetical protein